MIDELQSLLTTSAFGRVAEHHPEIDSTNRRALAWAEDGAPYGAVVIADHQTRGRGRLGRRWADQPGKNLLFTVILRPELPPDRLGLLSLAAGVAVAEAISPLTAPVEPALKWPNDVLLEGMKVCGILPEARQVGSRTVVALGVGLNVNQVDFPTEIADHATSLLLATGRTVERVLLFSELLKYLEVWTERLDREGNTSIIDAFTERMTGIGVTASVRLPNGSEVSGRISGVAPDGALILETPSGPTHLTAGELSLSPSPI